MNIAILETYIKNACANSSFIFQNEEQFRYALTNELEKAYKQVVVQKLEVDPKTKKNIYIDIVVKENENEYDLIELKYGTVGGVNNNLVFPLPSPDKIPNNNPSYRKKGFDEDIARLKSIVNSYNGKVQGFAVLLTNHKYTTLSYQFQVPINKTDFYCYIIQA